MGCHSWGSDLFFFPLFAASSVMGSNLTVLMAWTQRNKQLQNNKNTNEQKQGTSNHLIPGGSASLVLVGVGFGAFMVNSILADVDRIMIAASMT